MNARISAMDYSFQVGVDNAPIPTAVANEKEFENTGPVRNPQLISSVVRMDGDLAEEQSQMTSSTDDLFGAMTTTVSDGARMVGQQLNPQLSVQMAMNGADLNQQQNLEQDEGQKSILDTSLTATETQYTNQAQSFEISPMKPAGFS